MKNKLFRLIVALQVMMFAGFVFAQEGGVDFSTFPEWGSNWLLFSGVVLGLTHLARKAKWGAWIDGKIEVMGATAVIGAVTGLVVAFVTGITVEPFATYPGGKVVQGVTYGVAAGLQNFIGVNILDFLRSRFFDFKKDDGTATEDPSIPES